MVQLYGQDLKNKIGKPVTEGLGESYVDVSFRIGTKCDDMVSYVNSL